MTDLPVLGAALTIHEIETHRDWLLEKQRDIEVQDFVGAETLKGDWRPLAERIRGLLDGHQGRLGIHGPFWGLNIASPDPDIRDIVRMRYMQGLDVCAALGANQMVIHSPYTTWGHNNLDNWPGQRAQLIDYCHMTLNEVIRRAEDMGCVLVIENIEDKDPADRIGLVKSFDSPAVAVSLDTGHALYAQHSTGGVPVDYHVKAAGHLLHHVHLQDADGYADRHWALGDGTMQWHHLFSALGSLTGKPRLIIELRDKAGVKPSVAHLAALGLAQ